MIHSPFRGLDVASLLGEGAMGSVYLASHPTLGVPFVIKTFKRPREGFVEALLSEARLAARVNSPYVAGIVDAGLDRGVPFLIMQHIDGVDLGQLIHTFAQLGQRLPADFVAALMSDAATGLQQVHEAGVVHCDVKPSNLFLSGRGEVVVGDFGIAVEERTAMLDADYVRGTPQYMAPEQWTREHLDGRADVYALGGTALTALTGAPPFAADDLLALARLHLRAAPALPTPRDPVEAYLLSVVERCLRKRREERYPTAQAITAALQPLRKAPPRFVRAGDQQLQIGPMRVRWSRGDLAQQRADALVNAANVYLTMREGVSAALRDVGGAEIEREAIDQGEVPMGSVVWTGAGRLRARGVAHAVAALSGAVCIRRAMLLTLLGAELRGFQSLALPLLGTGIGQVPVALSAKLTLESIRTFARLAPTHVKDLSVVLYTEEALAGWALVAERFSEDPTA